MNLEDLLIGEFPELSTTPEEPEPVAKRSAAGEITLGGMRGLTGAERMIGQGLKWFSEPGAPTYEAGEGLRVDADIRNSDPEKQLQPDAHNVVTNALSSGAEMLPASVAPQLAAVVGDVLFPPGAPAFHALAATGTGVGFGASQAQDSYERVLADTGDKEKARKAGWISGGIEGGFEGLTSMVGGKYITGALRFLGPKSGASVVERVLLRAKNPQALKNFGLATLANTGVEVSTEMIQNSGEAAVERAYGAKGGPTPGEAALQAVSPTIGMSIWMIPFGGVGAYRQNRQTKILLNSLEDAAAPMEERAQAAAFFQQEMAKEDKDAADRWAAETLTAISEGKGIEVVDPEADKQEDTTADSEPAVQETQVPKGPISKAVEKAVVDHPEAGDVAAVPTETIDNMQVDPETGEIVSVGDPEQSLNEERLYGSLPEVRQETGGTEEVPPVRSENEGVVSSEIDNQPVTQVDVLAHEAATSPINDIPEPTEGQIKAGNYKKGHVKLHGMDISIENPWGSVRKGVDADGKEWETPIVHSYGYIKGTVGHDKDHLDVFLGPDAESAETAYVVDQKNKDGSFDEHKVVIGAQDEQDALDVYNANYEPGWDGAAAVTALPMDEFKAWAKSEAPRKGALTYKEVKNGKTTDTTTERTEKGATERNGTTQQDGQLPEEITSGSGVDVHYDNEQPTPDEQLRGLEALAKSAASFPEFFQAVRKNAESGEADSLGFSAAAPSFREAIKAENGAEAKAALLALYTKARAKEKEHPEIDKAAEFVAEAKKKKVSALALRKRAAKVGLKISSKLKGGGHIVTETETGSEQRVEDLVAAEKVVAERENLVANEQETKSVVSQKQVEVRDRDEKQTEVVADTATASKGSGKREVTAAVKNEKENSKSDQETEKKATGSDDSELKQIVDEFNSAQKAQVEDDFAVHHLFDPVAKKEVVRLQNKVKVYHAEHGWMTVDEAAKKIKEWKAHAKQQGKNSANSDKVVLSLFDLSGAWSQPWVDAGYQVYRFDIQDDAKVGDVNNFSTEFFNDWFSSFDGNDIYAVLGACPCTDFAVSGARHFAAKDKDGRTVSSVKLVHQTLATIEYFKPSVWVIENPVGRIEKLGGLPPWRLSFDPNHIGEPYTKKTLLWGRFNADLPIAPVEPTEGSKMWKRYGGKSMATKNARSVTPEGFAYSFFMANNAIDNPVMAIANKYDRLDRGVIESAVKAGLTESEIDHIVEDFYYQDLDDKAAEEALKDATAGKSEGVSDGGKLIDDQPGREIADEVGESLGGSRRELESMREVVEKELTDDYIANNPLSKIWPKKEVDDIEDPFLAAIASVVRGSIPSKPRTKYKVSRWTMRVKEARALYSALISSIKSGSIDRAVVIRKMKTGYDLSSLAAKIELLSMIDRSNWSRIDHVYESPDAVRLDRDGKKGKPYPHIMVRIDGKRHNIEGSGYVESSVDKVKSILDENSGEKKIKFELRGNKRDGFNINKKGDGEYRSLKSFSDQTEAIKYYRDEDNYADLAAAWEDVKTRDNVKKTDVRRKDNRARTGADHRKGEDVTPETFIQTFGFRGVEFGNWVKQGKNSKDRQGMLNQAYDALVDMANILDVPLEAISLNGTLGLGFGSRGSGRASAHYEPGRIVINLTKTRGAGSLGHEFFHALDNYFSLQRGKAEFTGDAEKYRDGSYITHKPEPLYVHKTQTSRPISLAQLQEYRKSHPESEYLKAENWHKDPDHPEGVRPEVEKKFAALVEALNQSPMNKRSKALDKGKAGYWSSTLERAARAFENYLILKMQTQGYDNDYLANVIPADEFSRNSERYPYLLEEEMAPVKEAFDNLFATIETKKTDKGTALFSLGGSRGVVATLTGQEISGQDLYLAAKDYFKNNLQGKTINRNEIGEVRVSGTGGKKTRRGMKTDDLKAKLIPAIADIIEKGTYHGREEVSGRSDDIVAFHYFDGYVDIGGDVVQVGVTVGEDSFGNLFYNINHDADRLWKRRKARLLPRLEARGDEPSGADDESASKFSIAADSESVNLTILNGGGRPASSALSDVEFSAALSRITAGMVDRKGFVVVESAEHLPAAILAEAENNGSKPDEIDGVFHRGKVYIVRKHISSVKELESIVFHEWYGHAGLYAMMGNDGVAVRKKMVELYKAMPPGMMLKISKKYGFNLSKYAKGLREARDENGNPMTDAARHSVLMEEMLAFLTEEYSRGSIATKVKEIIGAIRAWLRKNGFAKLAALSNSDLALLLKQARTHAELGAWSKRGTVVFNGVDVLQRLEEKGITEDRLRQLFSGFAAESEVRYSLNPENDPDVMDRMRSQLYVPEQIYEGAEKIYAEGSKVAAAEEIARGSLRGTETVREISRSGWPEGEYGQLANQVLRPEESKALKAWAVKNGLMLKNDQFDKLWKKGGSEGGTEHDVYFNKSDNRWYKRQHFTMSDTFTDYFQRLALTNHLNNGYAQYRLEGFVENNGELQPVVSQADLPQHGEPVSIQEINSLMDKAGFVRADKAGNEYMGQFRLPGQDYIISDHYNGNVRRLADGSIAFIDPLIKPDLESKKDRIEAAVLAEKYGIDDVRFRVRDRDMAALRFAERLTLNKDGLIYQMLTEPGNLLPERMKAAIGSVLSNPHWGSKKSTWKSKAYDLGLERSSNATEIKHEVMSKTDDYEGLEGFRDEYRKAGKEERKQIDRLLVEGDVKRSEYTEENLLSDKNPLGKPVSGVVRRAYLACRATIARATEVMFDRLGRLRLLPYEGSTFYDELVDLLDEKPTSKRLAKRFGLNLDALAAYRRIQKSDADLDRVLEKYRDSGYYDVLRDWLQKGTSRTEAINSLSFLQVAHNNFELMKVYDEVRAALAAEKIELMSAAQFKSQKYYKTLLDLLSLGEDHPMFEKEELYNAYLGVQEYDSQLAKLKNEWKTVKGYLPRLRQDGEQHVKVFEVDEDGGFVEVWMQPARTKAVANKLRGDVEKNLQEYISRSFDPEAHYEVVVEPNRATPEEIFLGIGSHRSIEALLSRTFEKAVDAGIMEDQLAMQQQVLRILSDEISARGFGRHKLARSRHLIEGYETENAPGIMAQFIGGMAGWLSKSEFAMRGNRLMAEIPGDNPHDKVWIKSYLDDSLKNSTYIDQWFGTARSFAALMFLGFKASSALLNATQNYIWGQAYLSKYTKGAARKILAAQRDVIRDRLLRSAGKAGVLSEEELWVLEEGLRRGHSHANYVRAMSGLDDSGGVLGKGQAGIRWMTEKAMIPFQAVETYWNREPALIAAYRVFKKEGVSKEEALKLAEKFVDDVHFVVGKENIPAALRKMGGFGRMLYTFQSYSHNYLLGMLTSLSHGEFQVVMRSLTALVLFGGLAAVPFGDDMDKWYRRMFGERPLRLLEKWIRETAGEYTDMGDQIADFVMHGAPALGGVNFSRAIAVNVSWLSPEDDSLAERVTGVWGGLAQKVRYSAAAARKGNMYRSLEYLSPEALANILRAGRHYSDGATTLSGRPIFGDDGRQVKYTLKDAVIRSFGFMPLEPSKQSQKRWDAVQAKQFWQDQKSDLLAEYRSAKNHEERKKVFVAIIAFNKRLRSAPGGVLVPPISGKTLKAALRYRPNRREIAYNR